MTLPRERSQALHNTREFLRNLLDPTKTPKVPKAIRQKAYWCLKHFPSNIDIDRASDVCPTVFGPYLGDREG